MQGHNLVLRKAKHTFLKKPSASPSPPKLHQEVSPTSKPSPFAVWVGQPGGLRVRRLQSTSPCLELSLTESQELNFQQRCLAAIPSSYHPSLVHPDLFGVIWYIFPLAKNYHSGQNHHPGLSTCYRGGRGARGYLSYKSLFCEFSFTTTISTLLLVALWYTGTMEPRRKMAASAVVREEDSLWSPTKPLWWAILDTGVILH